MEAMAENNDHNIPEPLKRVYWFAGIWLAGVLALAVFAFVARALMGL
jgi:hypothetical protein